MNERHTQWNHSEGGHRHLARTTGPRRIPIRYVIPAWEIKDRVEHKASGLVGTVMDFATEGHELLKVRFDGATHLALVHASDLVVHQAGIVRK